MNLYIKKVIKFSSFLIAYCDTQVVDKNQIHARFLCLQYPAIQKYGGNVEDDLE